MSCKAKYESSYLTKDGSLQVSLSLQRRLGLATLKYQRDQLHCHCLDNVHRICEKSSDALFDFTCSHRKPGLTSSTLRTSQELPLVAPDEHPVTFNSNKMQLMPSPNRKRYQSDSDSALPAKAARLSWKRSCQASKSSSNLHWHTANRQNHAPLIPEAPTPELLSPAHNAAFGKSDSDGPFCHFYDVGSVVNFSSPPSEHARPLRQDLALSIDTAGLPLYAGSSPTSNRVARDSSRPFLPCTPARKHDPLPTLASDLGSSEQPFNFADFVNVTPIPS